MQILRIISLALLLVYLIRIFSYRSGWKKHSSWNGIIGEFPPVSIVIPVRNEAASIGNLLNDLTDQEYPEGRYEIIIVDDHSTDNTRNIVESFSREHPMIRLLLLHGTEKGKKAALWKGIGIAVHSLILNTDGDCRASSGWIKEMTAGFINPEVRMMIAAVTPEPGRGLFHALQSLELFSHTAVSAGSAGLLDPILCSAANMAYLREDYFRYIDEQEKVSESGDDIFLLLWLKKNYPGSIRFTSSLKAVIHTRIPDSIASFVKQRLRWTSKSRYYRDFHILATALIVFGMNLLLAFLFFAAIIPPLFHGKVSPEMIMLFAGVLTVKSIADLLLLQPVLRHYQKITLLRFFVLLEIIYFMYVSFTGIFGQVLTISWKGRKINVQGN